MNIKLLVASILLLGTTGAALASDDSSAIRKQVVAELARARAAGELDITDGTYPLPPRELRSAVTRAQVSAELARERAAGEMDYAAEIYPRELATPPSRLTREAVSAEAARARAAGELNTYEGASAWIVTMHAAHASK